MNCIPGSTISRLLCTALLLFSSAAQAAVELSVNVNPVSAQPSQRVLVEILVTNSGASPESNIVVTMVYPTGMFGLSESLIAGPLDAAASCVQAGGGATCSAGEILEWNLGTLTPGQAVNLSLPPVVLSTAVDGTLITWEATVSDGSGALGTESATLTVDSTPALTVAIDEDQDPVPAGGTLRYTLRYGNRSGSSVTGTQLNFTLPGNSTFVSATGSGTHSGGVVNWNLATLPAGAVAQQGVEVTVDGGLASGTLLESAAAIDGTSSALPTERRATETAHVAPNAPLALSLDVTPLPAQTSQQILVEMTVNNPTGLTVFGGVVRLRYPTGMFGVSESLITGPLDAAASCAQAGGGTTCSAGEVLEWNLGALTPGQVVNLSLPPTVLSTAVDGTLITWAATVSDDSLAISTESDTLPIGTGTDTDSDTIDDFNDNCTEVANTGQLDTDGDNIGNQCDCDFNQDNFCGGPDFTLFIGCFNAATGGDPTCEAADMNGDGFVGGPDFTLFIGGFNGPPGPSGLLW